MKIAVWKTGHEIADTVADAVCQGLRLPERYRKCSVDEFTTEISYNDNVIEIPDLHIGYGILRCMTEVFKACDKAGKPWFNIDRGYFKPGHYDGYYRISLRGTQQTTGLDKLEPDYERWDALEIEILASKNLGQRDMVCPPTEYVQKFFGGYGLPSDIQYNPIQRWKGDKTPLQKHLNQAKRIITFNSSIGWEALRQGIPVISDSTHSIVGAYQKMVDKSIHEDLDERRRLFAIMSSLQLTLEEIKIGKLWLLIQNLLKCTLAGTAGKQ